MGLFVIVGSGIARHCVAWCVMGEVVRHCEALKKPKQSINARGAFFKM